ncbi:MAG: Uncharacterized protein conserved in bacteria (DUF2328) [Phormidesmis priestleyi Ana]|uniref:Uncharacterized protein conserved in bacteria (DUF2328) n=1 Tax=Phormidesmis priestleyi Ana TaxID=1666911 RepID=A0A0P8BGM0_9CYAN|nr:MAG: Uncharacterized protein conserved in bacteria (DUF2328) [Phormidesmis priestleyi Ana]
MPLSIRAKDSARIQFTYYAYIAGPMGDVFRYLLRNKAHSARKGKQMGLEAISAFWKPFSAHSVLGLSDLEVRRLALTSITELQQHIDLIRTTFNIPQDTQEMTKQDIEKMIEECLNARRNIHPELTEN